MIMVARISNVHLYLYLVQKRKIKYCSCVIFRDEVCSQPLQRIGSKLSSDGIQKPTIVEAQESGVEWKSIDWNKNRSPYISYLKMMGVEREDQNKNKARITNDKLAVSFQFQF